MGLRTRAAFFIGAYLAFFSSLASALGLGEIKLNSSLNQPLDAEIQLLHVRDLTEREILISVASPEEFERAGVERNFFVTDLQFKLELSAASGPVVRVTSRQPVREPFLNFIVSARWPSGKLLREYTLLVDLPVFTGSKAGPVEAAQPKPSATRSTPSSQPSAERPRDVPRPVERSRTPEPASTFSGDSYGPVGANETLWSIASRSRPDGSVSVQQTMLAIQRLNPEAFINGNINLLRRGQVLRIPDKEEIQKLTARDAIQQVAEQNRNWNRRTPAAAEQAQLEGSRNLTQSRTETTSVEGRVKLSTSTPAQSGRGAGAEEGVEGGAVSDALTQTQEELDAAGRENADLKSRIRAMEEQIETMERLVEVSSEEMRALELAAQQANQEAEVQEETPTVVAEDNEEIQSQMEEAVPAQPTEQPEQVQTPPAETKPVTPPQRQQSWLDLAKDNLLYIGIGLGALLLALIAFVFIRKRNQETDDFYEDYSSDASADFDFQDDPAVEDDSTVPFHSTEEVSDTSQERTAAEAETEDVVGECDIHIAYGQYDQAEEKLLRALEKEPYNTAVRLKLLEVFAAQGDADSFDYHYAKLRALGESDVVDRATAMRGTIDGIGEFDSSAYDTSDVTVVQDRRVSAQAEESIDFASDAFANDTLDFDFNEVDELVESTNTDATADAETLDFDLTLENEDARETSSLDADDFELDNELASAESDLADVDFDLGDLGPDTSDFSAEEVSKPSAEIENDFNFDFDGETEEEQSAFTDDAAADFDLDFAADEKLTNEFADDLVAERSVLKADDELDFADLDLALEENRSEGDLTGLDNDLDFDLDRDLQDVQTSTEEPPVLSGEDQDSTLSALGLEDLEDLDIDLSSEQSEPTKEAVASEAGDFDVEFDLDKEVNLDELDQELDALASDFGTDMEEPVLDFDDADDLSPVGADLTPEEQDFDDLVAEESPAKPRHTPDLTVGNQVASAEAANSLDFDIPDFDPENDDDSNLDFLSDNDETATKLDLARAYIDMGDSDGAKDILDEIIDEGNDQQKREAEALLARIG